METGWSSSRQGVTPRRSEGDSARQGSDLARRLWQAIEPIHVVVYFDQDLIDGLKAIGLRGFWMTYFAGRFAPLGAVGPGPAAAMAYGFSPAMVARSLPDAWQFASPAAVLETRLRGVASNLERRAAEIGVSSSIGELADLLGAAVEGCHADGRPLAAGWMDLDPGDDPYARLWVAAGVLREHRGDGHVLAAVGLDLLGLEATVTHAATGATTRTMMQRSRGWDDNAWDAAVARLQARGLLDADGRLLPDGQYLRNQLEHKTDQLAAEPVRRLGADGIERIIELATPLSRHLVGTQVVPFPNPIGVPRP